MYTQFSLHTHATLRIFNAAEEAPDGGLSTIERPEENVSEPPKYVVFILNDDYSTFDFVVQVLVGIFKKSVEEAIRITNEVHHKGKGACGIYSRQIAETKVELVEQWSKQAGYPLKSVMEEA